MVRKGYIVSKDSDDRIQLALEILEEEAETIANPDPVSRLYTAKRRLDDEVNKALCRLSHGENGT